MQALYQQQLTGDSADEIESQFSLRRNFERADAAFFRKLLRQVCAETEALDRQIGAASDIAPERIDPVERAILWSARTELQSSDAGAAVVINEAVELSREFGAEQSYRFVNAVLDRWVRANLPDEPESGHGE